MDFLKRYWQFPVLAVVLIVLEFVGYDPETGASQIADTVAAIICGGVIIYKARKDITLESLRAWAKKAYAFLAIVVLVLILRVAVPYMPASLFEGGENGLGHEVARYISYGGRIYTTTILSEEDLDKACTDCHDTSATRRGKLRGP